MRERGSSVCNKKSLLGSLNFFSAHKKIEKNCRTRLCANICRSQSEFTYVDSNVGLKFIFPLFIKNFRNHISLYMQRQSFTTLLQWQAVKLSFKQLVKMQRPFSICFENTFPLILIKTALRYKNTWQRCILFWQV